MKGYVQVYTGDGKGKTTAAIGLAVRAAGAQKRVFIAQFVKSQVYSEIKVLQQYIPQIEIKQYGLDCFIVHEPTKADIESAQKGLEEVERIVAQNLCDVLILDEANIALYYQLFSLNRLLNLLKNKPNEMEIVITGRKAPKALIDFADLVTEMKEVKHYYHQGVESRLGIEC